MKVSSALGEQIHLFSCPSEEEITFCYQFLINCLPDDIYQKRVVSLNEWLINAWIPRVWISDALAKFTRTDTNRSKITDDGGSNRNSKTSKIHRTSSASTRKSNITTKDENTRKSSGSTAAPALTRVGTSPAALAVEALKRNRTRTISNDLTLNTTTSNITNTSNSSANPTNPKIVITANSSKETIAAAAAAAAAQWTKMTRAHKSNPSTKPTTQKLTRGGSNSRIRTESGDARASGAAGVKLPQIKRRNQLLSSEADRILAITGNMTEEMKERLAKQNGPSAEGEFCGAMYMM